MSNGRIVSVNAAASPEVQMNDAFIALQPAGFGAHKASTTSGLTMGLYGGAYNFGGTYGVKDDTTVTLTASSTNYVESTIANPPVFSANTSGFTAGSQPLYTIAATAAGFSAAALVDYRIAFAGLRGPAIDDAYTTTAISGATTTLTAASNGVQRFTDSVGSPTAFTQTVTLPVATTLYVGWNRTIINDTAAGTLTVQSSGGNTVSVVYAGMRLDVRCILASGTTAASWSAKYEGATTQTGTGDMVFSASPTFSGTITAASANLSGALTVGTTLGVTGNAAFNTSQLFIDTAAGFIGVGTATPVAAFDIATATGGVLTLRRIDAALGGSNEVLGRIEFQGRDAQTTTNFVAAAIEAQNTNAIASDRNPGRLIFYTTPNTDAAALAEVMRLNASQNVGIGVGSNTISARVHAISTTEQLRLGYDTTNYWSDTIGSTGGRALAGVGAGGSLTITPTSGQNINLTLGGGGVLAVTGPATISTTLGITGLMTLGGGTLLATSTALTNGAAAAAGTLLNAPAAGNPTKWVPVNDNGTTRYIPMW